MWYFYEIKRNTLGKFRERVTFPVKVRYKSFGFYFAAFLLFSFDQHICDKREEWTNCCYDYEQLFSTFNIVTDKGVVKIQDDENPDKMMRG